MLSFIAPLLLALHADQAAWITKAEARKGADLVRKAGRVAWYCEPCNDEVCREDRVQTVTANPVEDGYHQVVINDEEADLAYVFIPKQGQWFNVALLMGLPVQQVSRSLPLSKCSSGSAPDTTEPEEPAPAPPNTTDLLEVFSLQSAGAQRLGSTLLDAWTSRTHSGATPIVPLKARIVPKQGVYWSTGNTLVLRKPANATTEPRFDLVEVQLDLTGSEGYPALCDREACTLYGNYEIVECRVRSKGIQSCTLRPTSSNPIDAP
jgi:hypothetical protein